ncbi:DUF2244 domain-containing protein [Roseovarius sp. MMSF_3281]|uniref:DUF2244 domain-containing protein n=1 Tax=Roseovarius sp. MMSF_3281 TaxID=3046694 RepID=UPI00273FE0D9|nr:DUF2244 domain-containing protein [Roseovarius sp. MMSF_3281]
MPYEWNEDTRGHRIQLKLWPHRSLPRRGFAAFVLGTFILITFPLYPLLGTFVLWGLLPFLLIAVGGIWWALERSYRDADMIEELIIDPDKVHLKRTDPAGKTQEWDCNSYWAKVDMYPTGGPVAHYITMSGKGREVEIGAFLSEDERKALHGELVEALRNAITPEPAQ